MLDLVLWSCLLALAPWALGLGLKLIWVAAGLISPVAANGSVALHRGPAHSGDLMRPVAARERLKILMRSNDQRTGGKDRPDVGQARKSDLQHPFFCGSAWPFLRR